MTIIKKALLPAFIGIAVSFSALCFIISLSLAESTASQPLSYIIVDLDGDGYDLIPLEKSQVYSDVDGDFLAERTEWIGSSDAFLAAMTFDEDRLLNKTIDRVLSVQTGGLEKIKKYDISNDNLLIGDDFVSSETGHISFFIVRDIEGDGFIESRSEVSCKMKSVKYDLPTKQLELSCEDGSTYQAKEIKFNYENSDVKWKSFCKEMGWQDRTEGTNLCTSEPPE